MHEGRQASLRVSWHLKCRAVLQWSEAVIQLTASAGDAYSRAGANRRIAGLRLLLDDDDE